MQTASECFILLLLSHTGAAVLAVYLVTVCDSQMTYLDFSDDLSKLSNRSVVVNGSVSIFSEILSQVGIIVLRKKISHKAWSEDRPQRVLITFLLVRVLTCPLYRVNRVIP